MSNTNYHKLTICRGGCSRKLETSKFDAPNLRHIKEHENIKLEN